MKTILVVYTNVKLTNKEDVLDKRVNKKTYPFLCIANFWSMNKLEANRKKYDVY